MLNNSNFSFNNDEESQVVSSSATTNKEINPSNLMLKKESASSQSTALSLDSSSLPFPTNFIFTYPDGTSDSSSETSLCLKNDEIDFLTQKKFPSASTLEKKKKKNMSTTRWNRRLQFGIDCPDLVKFKKWDPGNSYIHHLIIKNVSLKSQKIRYRISNNPYFLMNFPETVMLSAGMSCSFPILFKPDKSTPYKESLEFTCQLGTFIIPLLATLPEHNLNFQSFLDFAICPIRHVTTKTILLKNKSELDTGFTWSFLQPFSISPASGTLAGGHSCPIHISFLPMEAKPFVGQAICSYGATQHSRQKRLSLNGIGNFSYLQLIFEGQSTHFLHFGSVIYGHKCKKTLTLKNPTPVDAKYSIKPVYNEGSFHLSKTEGTIPSFGQLDLSLVFHPKLISTIPVTEAYQVTTISGNNFTFKCAGTCKGSNIVPSITSMVFADVKLGTSPPTRSFHLTNTSECSTFFHFRTCSSSVFKLYPLFGPIPPCSTVYINVTFEPKLPINYFREVTCVLENSVSFEIQFLATAYTDEIRPATFTLEHLEAYKHRCSIGMGSYGPNELNHLMKLGTIFEDPLSHSLTWRESNSASSSLGLDSLIELIPPTSQFFHASKYRFNESQKITVRNKTHTKVVCCWNAYPEDCSFSIEPNLKELPPLSSTDFNVLFKPPSENGVYYSEIEAYIICKSMRNFRLVHDLTFMPPHCLSLKLLGDTLSVHSLPQVDVSVQILEFSPCELGESDTRVFRITNVGDIPALYLFECNQTESEAFFLEPVSGYLNLQDSVLISVIFKPQTIGPYSKSFHLCLNHSRPSSQVIEMKGYCSRPSIDIKPSDCFFFPPTLMGMRGKRAVEIENSSLIPIDLQVIIPRAYEDIIEVDRKECIVQPHQHETLQFYFQPRAPMSYLFSLPLLFKKLNSSNAPMKKRLLLAGEGSKGALFPCKPHIVLDCILISTPLVTTKNEFFITNPTNCTIYYKLRILEKRDKEWVEDKSQQVSLQQPVDSIIPRSKKPVLLRLLLKELKKLEFKVEVTLSSPYNPVPVRQQKWIHLCFLTVIGVFPLLEIIHVSGNASNLFDLTQSFNVSKLNEALKIQNYHNSIKLEFPPQKQGSINAEVNWIIKNTGKVPLKWSLQAPQVNPFHAPSDPVESNAVIKISPKQGKLAPEETMKIRLSCDYKSLGRYEYPLELHVKCGTNSHQMYPLLFSVTVLGPNEAYLFHAGDTFSFSSVYIGNSQPLVSYMRLFNPGSTSISFNLDQTSLQKYAEENDGFDIFQCFKSSGLIEGGSYIDIPWGFQPIQCKPYQLKVTFTTSIFTSIDVNIAGFGSLMPTTLPNFFCSSSSFTTISPSSPFSLSPFLLNVYNVPARSVVTRIVLMKNLSTTPIYFYWRSFVEQNQIRIYPASGILKDKCLLKLYIQGTTTSTRCVHTFECIYSISPFTKSLTPTTLTKYTQALPSIDSFPNDKQELIVQAETKVMEGSTAPRFHHSFSDIKFSEEFRVPIQQIFKDCLDSIFSEIFSDDTFVKLKENKEWRFPNLKCPQTLLQDVLENTLVDILSEMIAIDVDAK